MRASGRSVRRPRHQPPAARRSGSRDGQSRHRCPRTGYDARLMRALASSRASPWCSAKGWSIAQCNPPRRGTRHNAPARLPKTLCISPRLRTRSTWLAAYVNRDQSLVSAGLFAYADVMYATAVVEGKVVRFRLSPALARAHRENRGKTMTEREAVAFVEAKRRARALRRARPYLESRS